jgi:transglutaminase-like putative cysteine protease
MYVQHFTPTLAPIATGKKGVAETVKIMCRMLEHSKADLELRHLALQLIEHVNSHSHDDEIEVLHNFVRDNIRYVMDIYDLETIAIPSYTLALGQGDCDDQSLLLAALLRAIGIPTMFVTASYNASKNDEHVYVWCSIDDREYHLDPTLKDMPYNSECAGATSKTYWG